MKLEPHIPAALHRRPTLPRTRITTIDPPSFSELRILQDLKSFRIRSSKNNRSKSFRIRSSKNMGGGGSHSTPGKVATKNRGLALVFKCEAASNRSAGTTGAVIKT